MGIIPLAMPLPSPAADRPDQGDDAAAAAPCHRWQARFMRRTSYSSFLIPCHPLACHSFPDRGYDASYRRTIAKHGLPHLTELRKSIIALSDVLATLAFYAMHEFQTCVCSKI